MDLLMSLAVLVALLPCFWAGMRLAERSQGAVGLVGFMVPLLLAVIAVSVAASARGDDIWKTASGVYTDMPDRYAGEAKLWTPSRDRVTVVTYQAAVVGYRSIPPRRGAWALTDCRTAWLRAGGTTVCPGERAVIEEQRVRRRGYIVTSTDTVLRVGNRELMRVRGHVAQSNPSKIKRE
jgi:hypothetical protein